MTPYSQRGPVVEHPIAKGQRGLCQNTLQPKRACGRTPYNIAKEGLWQDTLQPERACGRTPYSLWQDTLKPEEACGRTPYSLCQDTLQPVFGHPSLWLDTLQPVVGHPIACVRTPYSLCQDTLYMYCVNPLEMSVGLRVSAPSCKLNLNQILT